MSETGKLAEALAKAQGQFTNVGKDRDVKVKMKAGGEYTFSYATLAAIWTVIRKPLSENGLAVVQVVNVAKEGISVKTILMHSSGESVESPCSMPVEEWSPKGIGSAISYARRYGLSAMVGVVSEDEDDDASAAQGATMTARRDAKPPPAKAATTRTNEPATPAQLAALADDVTKEVGLLRGLAQTAKVPTDVDALRPRYNALQKVLPRVEWDALGESLKARKTELSQ